MNWTLDYYALGKKGVYRIVFRGPAEHVQLLRPGETHWEDILHFVKPAGGKYPEVAAYDASPKGWETVEGGTKQVTSWSQPQPTVHGKALLSKIKSDKWTPTQDKIAAVEGWCLSERSDGVYQIQKCDDSDKFASDDTALAYVIMRARNGGHVHQRALRLDGTGVPS